ncbi:MAG: hypothetical protein KDJ86_07200 [Bauldia sp.]|uniref:hypothetical protein n=1 Tax=Bauldia sp. TaxID=2575872 RepID=UPI001D35EF41|nr:hypothetical protein [Bauldia sp.]MCB1495553.1 hypothetical protein [Bauldia sp.]
MTSNSPKPAFGLSVGIIGHRPNRLPQETAAIEARIDGILLSLRHAAEEAQRRHRSAPADGPASLTLISALAEGADRIAARSAVRNGIALDVVLPFPVADYERDFAEPASRTEYRQLIDAASRVEILPGDYHAPARDYDPVGRVILDTADIILGVWDGGPSGGKGGTTDLLRRAAARDIPIIYVDPSDRTPPRLLWSGLADHPPGDTALGGIRSAPLAGVIGRLVDGLAKVADQGKPRGGTDPA